MKYLLLLLLVSIPVSSVEIAEHSVKQVHKPYIFCQHACAYGDDKMYEWMYSPVNFEHVTLPVGYAFEPFCVYGGVCVKKGTNSSRKEIVGAIEFVKDQISSSNNFKYTYSIESTNMMGVYLVNAMLGGGNYSFIVEHDYEGNWLVVKSQRVIY